MTITIDIIADETFNNLTETEEANDGSGLGLREVIGLIGAGTSVGPVTFNTSLTGAILDITNGSIEVTRDLEIFGDINGDGTSDITIQNLTSSTIFDFTTDGTSFFNNNVTIVMEAMDSDLSRPFAFFVEADSLTFTNGGNISFSGLEGFFGDRTSGFNVEGDNFTFINTVDARFEALGRHGVDISYAALDGFPPLNASYVNHGYMSATDDVIRMPHGTITNFGTIESLGTHDLGGRYDTPGLAADGISIFGPYNPDELDGNSNFATIDNMDTGTIVGARSAIFMSTSGTINNDGMITGIGHGIIAQRGLFEATDPNLGITTNTPIPFNFTLNNSGTITHLDDNPGFDRDNGNSAISVFGSINNASAVINNSGEILSPNFAIQAFTALTVNNSSTGVINGDTDGNNNEAISFQGARTEDFEVTAREEFFQVSLTSQVYSVQNVEFFADGTASIDGHIVQNFGSTQIIRILNSDAPPILALIDVDQSILNNAITYQRDNDGNFVFPDSVTLAWSGGMITVTTDANGPVVTDAATGQTVFNPRSDLDFADIIINDGRMIGDIYAGLGDDSVSNNGIINGDIDLGAGNDIFISSGTASQGQVFGGTGDDQLTGNFRADSLNGGTGDDLIIGGAGGDILNGGAGQDMTSYETSTNRVVINMATNIATSGHATGDSLISIEDIRGTNFGDSLTGSGTDNVLYGGNGFDILSGFNGNDTLYGETGDDFLTGGRGADIINGGAGNDTARYVGSTEGVRVDLNAGTAFGGDAEGDVLTNIERLFGSNHDDVFTGDAQNNWLFGDGGNDTLDGGAGIDKFFGGAGSDTFVFSAGDTYVYVADFQDDVDNLDFSSYGFDTVEDALANMNQFGAHVRFFVDGDTMLILNTTLDAVADDIIIDNGTLV